MKRIATASILSMLLLCGYVSAQNKSVYTSTKANACRTIESTGEGAGSYIGECAGTGGYKVQLVEGDIRQTLNIIAPRRKKFELNFWNYFGAFSSIGEKIEWRVKGGIPVALIARYNVADPEGTGKGISYLMVSKIGTDMSCVTDIVKPSPTQNAEARRSADGAATRECLAAN
jgi:hypothetical protein